MSETVQCPHTTNLRRVAHEQRRSATDVPLDAGEHVLRPAATARFSTVITQMVALSTAELPVIGKHALVKSPWRKLQLDLGDHMKSVAQQVMNDPSNHDTLKSLNDIQQERSKHDSTIYANPRKPLTNGIGTSVRSSLGILRDMHTKAAGFHGADNYIDMLRKSPRPLFEVAGANPVQLIAFNDDVLHNDRLPDLSNNDHSFNYETPIMDIRLTRASRKAILWASPPQPEAQTIGELINPYSETIGCPIMLNPEDVVSIWRHAVAAADERDLLE